jgi:hypothetical protein
VEKEMKTFIVGGVTYGIYPQTGCTGCAAREVTLRCSKFQQVCEKAYNHHCGDAPDGHRPPDDPDDIGNVIYLRVGDKEALAAWAARRMGS